MKTKHTMARQAVGIWFKTAARYVMGKSVATTEYIKLKTEKAQVKLDDFLISHAICVAKRINRQNLLMKRLKQSLEECESKKAVNRQSAEMSTWI